MSYFTEEVDKERGIFVMFRTNAKKWLISRISLVIIVSTFLSLALISFSTPSAHAQTDFCGYYDPAVSNVYDSYNHLEGQIYLEQDTCTGGIHGYFQGNANTWKSVTVYVEYSYVYGYLQGGPYGWKANGAFFSPYYHSSSCYYAEVDLLDNRGINNWVGTSNVCF